jgi:hypothetical protein
VARIRNIKKTKLPIEAPAVRAICIASFLGIDNFSLYSLKSYCSCPREKTVLILSEASVMKFIESL